VGEAWLGGAGNSMDCSEKGGCRAQTESKITRVAVEKEPIGVNEMGTALDLPRLLV
jgi:hypothetical protein